MIAPFGFGGMERKVRTPQSGVLANGQDLSGLFRLAGWAGQVRIVPQKIYRPGLEMRRGKGEKVRSFGT